MCVVASVVLDLMSGQVDFMLILAPEAMPYVKAGKLRSLALTTQQRSPMFPDLPTVAESGIKDFELVVWYILLAPTATPKDVVARLHSRVGQIRAPWRNRLLLSRILASTSSD